MSLMEMRKLGKVVRFQQDDFIVSEGEIGGCMYIILDGQADVYLNSFDDLPLKVHEIQKGDFFGEMALLEHMPRSATIIAAKDTIAIEIDESNFESLLTDCPDIAMRMLKTLSGRIRKTNEELLHAQSGQVEQGLPLVEHEDFEETKDTSNDIKTFDRLISDDMLEILDLLPKDHNAYKCHLYQEDYEDNVLNKEVVCPICNNLFQADLIRTSRLMLKGQEPLFRKIYSNMNPLASNIWTCPHCYYSQYYYNFHGISVYKKQPIKDLLKKVKQSVYFSNSNKDDINVVFIKYFLAAFVEEHTPAPNMINLGKNWLNLYWLYKDIPDIKMADIALNKAYYYYKEAYYNGRQRLMPEEELRLGVLVAELFTLCNEEKNAYNLLAKLLVDKNMPSRLKKYASDLMYETKQSIHKNKL